MSEGAITKQRDALLYLVQEMYPLIKESDGLSGFVRRREEFIERTEKAMDVRKKKPQGPS